MVRSGIKTSQKIPDREIIRGPSCPILCESYNPPMCCENPSGYWPHFHFCCLRLISDQAYCCIENPSKWKGSAGMIWFRYSKYSEAVWHGIWIIPSNIKMQVSIKIYFWIILILLLYLFCHFWFRFIGIISNQIHFTNVCQQ